MLSTSIYFNSCTAENISINSYDLGLSFYSNLNNSYSPLVIGNITIDVPTFSTDTNITQEKNLLTWFAFEETARELNQEFKWNKDFI